MTHFVGQNYIGSVIKQCYDDDDDELSDDDSNLVFGITTVISLKNSEGIQCIGQIRDFLMDKAEKNSNDAILKMFKNAFQTHDIGLLINERFVNIPAQISLPLFQNLEMELHHAISKNKPFNFSSFILISKFYRKVDQNGKVVEDLMTNLEEEVFSSFVDASFEYSVADEADSGLDGNWDEDDSELIPYRKVSLIDMKKLHNVIESIKELLK